MRHGLAALGALLLCASSGSIGADGSPAGGSGEPLGKPKFVVAFTVTVDAGAPIGLSELDNAMARVLQGDQHLGISPIVRDESKGLAAFKVYRIAADSKGKEKLTKLSTLEAQLGSDAVKSKTEPEVAITLLSIRAIPAVQVR